MNTGEAETYNYKLITYRYKKVKLYIKILAVKKRKMFLWYKKYSRKKTTK